MQWVPSRLMGFFGWDSSTLSTTTVIWFRFQIGTWYTEQLSSMQRALKYRARGLSRVFLGVGPTDDLFCCGLHAASMRFLGPFGDWRFGQPRPIDYGI
jgi:hypothetical protein